MSNKEFIKRKQMQMKKSKINKNGNNINVFLTT